MLSHTSTTTTVHAITLDSADAFFGDVPGWFVRKIKIVSTNGILEETCTLYEDWSVAKGVISPVTEEIKDILRKVGLVDPAIFTADWAVRTLQERRLDPNDRLILCVKELRSASGRALHLTEARDLALSVQDRFL